MMKLLRGPLLRQLMQFVSGGLLASGFMTSAEWMQITGGAGGAVTVCLVVYARIRAARAQADLLDLTAVRTLAQKSAAASAVLAQRRLP